MKKLPWSSITSGLVRNFLTFGPSCAAALATIASSRIAGKKRQMSLMESSSSFRRIVDRCRAFVDHTPIIDRTVAEARNRQYDDCPMKTQLAGALAALSLVSFASRRSGVLHGAVDRFHEHTVGGRPGTERVCLPGKQPGPGTPSWNVSSKKHRERLLVRTMTEQAGIRRTRPQCGGRRPVFSRSEVRIYAMIFKTP